jgi:hypothetical protein
LSAEPTVKDRKPGETDAEQAERKRALMDAEDWKDSPGQKTICEYHKDGLPDGVCEKREVDDLDYFSDFWKGREGGKLRSEYHKEGAPYIEEPSEWDGHRTGANVRPAKKAAEPAAGAGSGQKARSPEAPVRPAPPEAAAGRPDGAGEKEAAPSGRRALPPLERLIDIPSIELATYAMFRSIIGRGIRIPLKREGIIDMDIVVKDRDIVLNTNQLQFELPSLAIWRIIFAYQGKPIMEYGRGVKNNMKIHRLRLFKLLLQIWWRGRRKAKKLDQEGGAGQ